MTDPTPPAVSDARLTEREWRLREELREHWFAFCDADVVPEGFIERMEAAGFASLRRATREDWESAFAADRGIEKGGAVWALTPAGRAALDAGKGVP